MSDSVPTPPNNDRSLQDIHILLDEIRRQNIMLRRYICVLGAGMVLMILMQAGLISTIINYGIAVLIVLAILLTAPLWSPMIVGLTDRISWYPKKKKDRRDSAADPV